jgi:hypothetical protein
MLIKNTTLTIQNRQLVNKYYTLSIIQNTQFKTQRLVHILN